MNTDAFGFAHLVHLETQDGEPENDKKCACVTGEKKVPFTSRQRREIVVSRRSGDRSCGLKL